MKHDYADFWCFKCWKTTVGELLAGKLGYEFHDLDEEVKNYYHTTLEDFVNSVSLEERDEKRGIVIDELMKNGSDQICAITPMSYTQNFENYLCRDDVLAIELQDEPENIFERLVFSDENDFAYKDDEYKNAHKEHYLYEIGEDISWYSKKYRKVQNKFHMNNDDPDTVVQRIIADYKLFPKYK